MDIVYVWNYLNKHYSLDYFKITQYEELFITDIRVTLEKKLLKQKYIYASACHSFKEISLIKALSELIERLVFLSPFVGPIEFINEKHYTPDINRHLLPLAQVTPYFSLNPIFHSYGHACHTEYLQAKLISENEYFEHVVKNNLIETLAQSVFLEDPVDGIQIKGLSDLTVLRGFKKIIIQFTSFYFCLIWHPIFADVVGTAVHQNKEHAIEKAYYEGISLLLAATDKGDISLEVNPLNPYNDIKTGYYISSQKISSPLLIKRHSQILSDLNLCLFQAVHHA